MCRNIKTLYNFEPPATEEEVYLSSLQFVRKLSGFTRPSKANQLAFDRAVDKVSRAARELIDSLVTNSPPRDREIEAVAGNELVDHVELGDGLAVEFKHLPVAHQQRRGGVLGTAHRDQAEVGVGDAEPVEVDRFGVEHLHAAQLAHGEPLP